MIRLGDSPHLTNPEFLQGTREAIALGLVTIVSSIRTTLVFFFLIVLLRVLVRNRWVAAAIFVLLFTVTKVLGRHPLIDTPVWLVIYGVAAFAVVRFGLVALAVAVLTVDVFLNVPITLDFSNWYAVRTVCVLLGVAAIAAWGFYTSLAGQRLWKDELFD